MKLSKKFVLILLVGFLLITIVFFRKNDASWRHFLAQKANTDLKPIEDINDEYNDLLKKYENFPDNISKEELFRTSKILGTYAYALGINETALNHYSNAYEMIGSLPANYSNELNTFIQELYLEYAATYMKFAQKQSCLSLSSTDEAKYPYIHENGALNIEHLQKADILLDEILQKNPTNKVAKLFKQVVHVNIARKPSLLTLANSELKPFKDIAPQLGLNTFNKAGSAIIEDFNNDGHLDIFTSSEGIHLFLNSGNGTFKEITESAGLAALEGGLNALQADFDNDGYTDILLLRGGWRGYKGKVSNALFHNNGDNTFTDVTKKSGLDQKQFPSLTAAWADYDNDGDLDLYIGNQTTIIGNDFIFHRFGRVENATSYEIYPSQLFNNNGNGTFNEVSKKAGVSNNENAVGVSWGDYNNDGYVDLYVSNMDAANKLYKNNGNGTFTDVAEMLVVTNPRFSFSTWFWDYNNDGNLDLFVSDREDHHNDLKYNVIYLNDGNGNFKDVSEELGFISPIGPMGANFEDINNDGWKDIYLGNGHMFNYALAPNAMFLNESGDTFRDISKSVGVDFIERGHGVAFGDIDNDGDQDIFHQLGGAFDNDAYCDVLLENSGTKNSWITIKLTGTTSNTSAIGAKIKLVVENSGINRVIYSYVNTGGSFGGNSLQQEIGLGKTQKIETLEILWPGSHSMQIFKSVDINQKIEITEGEQFYSSL